MFDLTIRPEDADRPTTGSPENDVEDLLRHKGVPLEQARRYVMGILPCLRRAERSRPVRPSWGLIGAWHVGLHSAIEHKDMLLVAALMEEAFKLLAGAARYAEQLEQRAHTLEYGLDLLSKAIHEGDPAPHPSAAAAHRALRAGVVADDPAQPSGIPPLTLSGPEVLALFVELERLRAKERRA